MTWTEKRRVRDPVRRARGRRGRRPRGAARRAALGRLHVLLPVAGAGPAPRAVDARDRARSAGFGRFGFAGGRRPPSPGPRRRRPSPAGRARHRAVRRRRPRSRRRDRAAARGRGRGRGARARRCDRVRRLALAADPGAPLASGRGGRRVHPLVVRGVLRGRDGAPRTPVRRRPRRVPAPVRGPGRRRSASCGSPRASTARASSIWSRVWPSSRSRRSSCGGRTTRSCRPSSPNAWATRCPGPSVALLPGCGHFLLEDAPETVAPLIAQWLRTQYLRLPQAHEHEEGAVTVELGRRPPEDDRW